MKTTIVTISHQSPPEVLMMCQTWQELNSDARIHVAYGGSEEAFHSLDWPHKIFISDPRLRTRDHQRERQSYRGVMQSSIEALAKMETERVLMVECDVVPLRAGLVEYLLVREREEGASVLGINLRRVDETCDAHYLAHRSHAHFDEWLKTTVRDDQGVILAMLGCLSWWTWDAFAAVAASPEPMPIYLELAMPTTAHHLGFRVRNLPEFEIDIEYAGEMESFLKQRKSDGRWLLHPCKRIWKKTVSKGAG